MIQGDNNLREYTTLIFLGAGASAQDGAPTQSRLISTFIDQYQNFSENKKRRRQYKRISSFFEHFFQINLETVEINSCSFPTFEEILGIVDLAIDRRDTFRGDMSHIPGSSLLQLRQDLVYLIGRTLKQSLETHALSHQKLIDKFAENGVLAETLFFTTNYDILIDNALVRHLKKHYSSDWMEMMNYGVAIRDFESNNLVKPNLKEAIPIIKLHGSLNWLYCSSCDSLFVSFLKKQGVSSIVSPELCQDNCCKTRMFPIIIPPSYFKVMSNSYLQRVWNSAEKLLKNVQRIIFCGYSFPDADIHVKYLLKRAEINYPNFSPIIHIFNKNPEKSVKTAQMEKIKKPEFFKRFQRFFKSNIKVINEDKPFYELCTKGIASLSPVDADNETHKLSLMNEESTSSRSK